MHQLLTRSVLVGCLVAPIGAFCGPAAAQSAPQAFSWVGTWEGKWGGRTPTSITVTKKDTVKYVYNGAPQNVAWSRITKTVRFGNDFYVIVVRKTGENTATATYDNDNGDHSVAKLSRR